MTPSKNNIVVRFDPVPTLSGIIVPERYMIQESDEEGVNNAYGVNTNRKAINPQVVTIIKGNNEGKKAFVYYGAYEIAKWLEDDLAIIPEGTIFFYIDPIQCVEATYLGEEVFSEGKKTASGIYITPYAEKKEGVLIKITHIPSDGGVGDVKVGDTVVTVDSYQYDLRFENKKYIKLRSSEIIGKKVGEDYVPIGDKVLVEYIPDAQAEERLKENERRYDLRYFMTKNHLHYTDSDLQPVTEPKITEAKLLGIGDKVRGINGDRVMVMNYQGCILPNGQWITSIDNVLGVLWQ